VIVMADYNVKVKISSEVDGQAELRDLRGEIDRLGDESGETADESLQLSNQLDRLQRSAQVNDELRSLTTELEQNEQASEEAWRELARLQDELDATTNPSKALERQFQRQMERTNQLGTRSQELRQ